MNILNAFIKEEVLYFEEPSLETSKKIISFRKNSKVYNNFSKVSLKKLNEEFGDNNFKLLNEKINLNKSKFVNYSIENNSLKDWSLSEDITTCIRSSSTFLGSRINVTEEIEIDILEDKEWNFSALLACHRSEGNLILKISQNNLNLIREFSFDSSMKGGPNRNKYLPVSSSFNLKKGKLKIKLEIEHLEITKSDAKDFCYFIASAKIFPKDKKLSDLSIKPRKSDYFSFINYSKNYYSFPFDNFSSPDDNSLIVEWSDGSQNAIFNPIDTNIQITKNYNHGFSLVSNKVTTVLIYINYQFVTSLVIEKNNTEQFFSIPIKYLTGELSLLEIRDISACQIFKTLEFIPPKYFLSSEIKSRQSNNQYLYDVSIRSSQRYYSLKKFFNLSSLSISKESLSIALDTLEKNNHNTEKLSLQKIKFPSFESPLVSIIIPAHNKIKTTYYCLCSILAAYNKTKYEVIVVDDGSEDQTKELEEIIDGIQVIHNKIPLRFIGACNLGVSKASGEFIVLLNNDTEVTYGWLDELIEGFTNFKNVGAVGSRLLYPDGTLQDAGGIVYGNGQPANYGNKQNPWNPKFRYARQVDYLSGAALMTKKLIWNEVKGLSEYLYPMYYEDTDFSFKVRESGYKTYYIPTSIVYHIEGVTCGTDISKGFKSFQEVNASKFKKRWGKVFANDGREKIYLKNRDLEKDRNIKGRILFIDYMIPQEDTSAGSYAAVREMEVLISLGYKVTFLPQDLLDSGKYTVYLEKKGIEVITSPFYLSLESFIKERGKEFDLAYITRYYVVDSVIDTLKIYAPNCKTIFMIADLHFLRELRTSVIDNKPSTLALSEKTKEKELTAMKKVDQVITYNEIEGAVIFSETKGLVNPMKCPWVVKDSKLQGLKFEERKGIAFLGGFNHPPNFECMKWFVSDIMPLFNGEVELSIYGSSLTEEMKLKLEHKNVKCVGFIDDVEEVYVKHLVFIAPLLSGAGIKGKVIGALRSGIPTVLSPIAAEGTQLRHKNDCLIAKTNQEWTSSILDLMNDKSLWEKISSNSINFAKDQYSFESGKNQMKKILESVDLY